MQSGSPEHVLSPGLSLPGVPQGATIKEKGENCTFLLCLQTTFTPSNFPPCSNLEAWYPNHFFIPISSVIVKHDLGTWGQLETLPWTMQ